MTVIKNVVLVTMDQELTMYPDGYLRFEEDKIIDLGPMDAYEAKENEEVIHGKGGILMPGMINTHTHLAMIPFRGLQDDAVDRLRRFLLPMENQEMTPDLVRVSSQYAIAELLLSGVTTCMDMYYYEEEVAKAAEHMGIRAFLGQTIIDQKVCDAKNASMSLAKTEAFIKKYKEHPLIVPCVAPHSTITCSLETLGQSYHVAESYDVPWTMHVSEMDYEMKYYKDKYDMTPIGFLDANGLLDERLLAAHCIFMSEDDMELFADKKAGVAHCIGANTKAAKGVAPVGEMLKRGINVGLGTDGPSSGNTLDIITQFKLCANFHKTYSHDRSAFPAKDIIHMGTLGGAKALGIDKKCGSLEVGKQADFVLIETESVNMFPLYDPYSAMVYSANSQNVDRVFVAGKCLVENHQLKLHDLISLKRNLYDTMTRRDNSLFKEQWLEKYHQ